jgi:uncharacterized repeat protein (TIGR01451 family)
VSNNAGASGGPFLAMDSQGTAHLAWYDASPGNWEILYATRPLAGEWSAYENVSLNANYSLNPGMVIGHHDEVGIAWQDYGGPGPRLAWQGTLEYRDKDSGQDFNAPRLVSATFGFGGMPEVRDPRMAVDSANETHLIWAGNSTGGNRIFYARRSAAGDWTYPQVLNPGFGMSQYPVLAIDAHNRVHVAWQEGKTVSGDFDIYYAYADLNGPWSAPLDISHNAGASETPALIISADGTLHIVWKDNLGQSGPSDILYARKSPGGAWTEAVNVADTAGDSAGPAIAEDGAGGLHVVWYDGTPGNWEILYSTKQPGGDWTDAVNVSQTPGRSGHPTLIYDGRGWLHLAWNDETPGNFDIFYSAKSVPVVSSSFKQGPLVAMVGAEARYTIVAHNNSALQVTVWMTDPLPVGLMYVPDSAQAADGVVTVDGDEVRCTGDVAAGGDLRLTLRTVVGPEVLAGSDIVNRATISDSNGGMVEVEAQAHVLRSSAWLPLIIGERR